MSRLTRLSPRILERPVGELEVPVDASVPSFRGSSLRSLTAMFGWSAKQRLGKDSPLDLMKTI